MIPPLLNFLPSCRQLLGTLTESDGILKEEKSIDLIPVNVEYIGVFP